MGRENVDNWHVKKCSPACEVCQKEFQDRENLYSSLFFEGGEYLRKDVCESCWNKESAALSSWKTTFIVPPPPAEEAVKKENAESLLRKLLAKENDEDLNAVFILTVMLERKKLLVERDTQTSEDGRKLRIYEHKKTGETFMVIDPELKLAELEQVQDEVVVLLGGQPRNAVEEPESEEPAGEAQEPTDKDVNV
ncbi:MAG: hypothetical protein HKP10_07245 [Kiritimatiellales bacterium]|nr:hypothetical protein [Kiritimatiellales bacterium]